MSRWSLILILMIAAAAAGGACYFWFGPPAELPPQDRFEAALDALEAEDYESVRETMAALRSSPGYEDHCRILQVGLLVRNGNPSLALETLKAMPPKGELAALIYQFTGEALYKVGQPNQALFCMGQLLELEPENVEAHRWLAAIYYDLGSLQLARYHLGKVIELAPDDYRPHRLRAVIHSDFEQYAEAVKDFRRALELPAPESVRADIRRGLADALLKAKEFRAVIELYADAEPAGEVWLARSIAWRGMAEQQKSQQALAEAQQLMPDDPEVWKQQALLAVDRNELAEAKEQFDKFLRLNPHDVEVLYQQALVEKKLGNEEASARLLERKESSQKLFEEMTELSRDILTDPEDVRSRERLAEICDQLGLAQMAVVWRKAARESALISQMAKP